MAPGQVPHQSAPWKDAHPFLLLSPLMGLLSRAWSHLRGPGSPEPWLVEAVTSADQEEAGLEGETKASLATHHAPGGRYPQEEDGEASWGTCPDLKANSSLLEAWGLSDDADEEYGEEEATSVPREQGSEFIDGQPVPLCPSLLIRTLQDPPREEESEEGGVAEDKEAITFSFPLSHWECCPGVEEEKDGEAVNKESPRTSTSSSSPGSKPTAWVDCSGEEEDRATKEEERTIKEATKTSISPSTAGSHPRAWECCSGEESEEEKDKKAENGEADPEPHSSIRAQRPLLRPWQCQPTKITEEDDEEQDEFSDSGAAEGPSSIPPTSAFLRAWVYQPGEDTEEEADEFSDSGAAEEQGAAEGPSSIPPTSAFLRAWVYRPGEDTEEEDEEENEDDDDSEAAVSGPSPSLQAQSALLRGRIYQPGKETEGGDAAEEWGEAGPCPFRVAIYVPGEKPPPPWAPPQLPLRLQRRLKSAETPTREMDPETPLKARKVRFSEKVTIHFLAVWAGPAQAARRGPWEQLARDRSRFAHRIARAQEELGPCLTPAARARAWARLGNSPPSLTTIPAPTHALQISSVQATPLSHAVAFPSPSYVSVSPCLDLSGRRG
ncbi:protein phosphatase 1 regulatory subunit 15A [Diceros bicornis minor]|uniref:protein phosphatase 1 regulatory subunit 15A n=1 Tax=Diceros bicornis minor TaxID=77932 RepID=UPI0026EA0CD6|nr:protein phosphatase 1 regulatory subunit 15A [Diceros bicornis minor]